MRCSRLRGRLLPLLVVAGLAGCVAEGGETSVEATEGRLPADVVGSATEPIDGMIADEIDLAGVEIWVGGTLDAEGVTTDALLAELTVQALRAAGATVRVETDLGGGAVRDALLAGEVDLYWEGVGDAWTVLLRQPADGLSGEEISTRLAVRDLAENGVAWLSPIPVEDGPRLAEARRPPDGPTGSLSAMAELVAAEGGDEIVVCVTGPFMTYPEDGRVAVEEALEVALDDEQLRVFEPEPVYPETSEGDCRFGLVENTSGRVAEYDLSVLDDDVGAFLPNPVAVAMREDLLLATPDAARALVALADRLDAEAVREMNRSILIDEIPVAEVAATWLAGVGLVEEGRPQGS